MKVLSCAKTITYFEQSQVCYKAVMSTLMYCSYIYLYIPKKIT